MRRGGRRIDWTTEDVAWLCEHAGRLPEREICRHLRRSSASVRCMAHRLRARGVPVSLRHFEPTTTVCPACGRASATARETGICRPCQLARQLSAIKAQTARLARQLPASERETYERTEASLAGRAIEHMPKPPARAAGQTYYQRRRAEEAYAVALERWEARRMERTVRAAQKRKERVAHKVRAHVETVNGTNE